MGKKKFRKGDLNWAERNIAYPLARGVDLAANDWFGERGLARGLTQAAGLPAYQEAFDDLEGNDFANFAAEVPRAMLSAGPLGPAAMGGRILPMTAAGALAGAARDPGQGSDKQQAERRTWNTMLGAGATAAGGLIGPAIGRLPYQIYHRVRYPASNAAMRQFIGSADGSGQMLVKDPAAAGRAAETLPRWSGTSYRAQPADAFADRMQGLKPGDVFKPGRPMSSSARPETAQRFAGEVGNKGPMIVIRNKSGRDARWLAPDEQEIITNPNASYRVLGVTRDPKTGAVTRIEIEEIGPSMSVGRRAVQGVMETGPQASAAGSYASTMSAADRINARAEMERRARVKGRPAIRKPAP
jgi:hypothetical protein